MLQILFCLGFGHSVFDLKTNKQTKPKTTPNKTASSAGLDFGIAGSKEELYFLIAEDTFPEPPGLDLALIEKTS